MKVFLFHFKYFQLYVQDMKNKRDRVVTDKRDIHLLDEDEVDFFQVFRRQFFGQQEDPWGVDEDLLAQIWEEIKLEGLFNSYNILLT